MQSLKENIFGSDLIGKNNLLLITALTFCGLCGIIFILNVDLTYKNFVILFFLSSLSFILLNFKLTFIILIFCLFIELNYITYSFAEFFVLFVIISLLVTYKKINFSEKNYLLVPYFIFLLTVIPSYLNSIDISKNLLLSLHLLVFFLLFFCIPLILTSYKEIRLYFVAFLLFALINSIFVIYLAITSGHRVFGFTGVMYVDYGGIAIVITLLSLLYKKEHRLITLLLIIVFSLALIFTQTRNAWISTGITLIFILFQFVIVSPRYGYSRIKILLASLSIVIVMTLSVILVNNLSPKTFARVETKKVESNELIANNMVGISSLATRFFIWQTAWNAFRTHPYIGIGFYSFPISSHEYSSLDNILFKQFVESLTPHETFIALATETGIIGLAGFLYFLIVTIRQSWRTYKKSITPQQQFYSNLIFWILIYILASMTMTDAWLWGDGIVLWGIILGFSVTVKKILLDPSINFNTCNTNNFDQVV